MTESDAYELDTSQAVAGLQHLLDQLKNVRGEQEKDKESTDSLTLAHIKGSAAYDMMRKAIGLTVDVLKESTHAAIEAEQVDRRVAASLRNAGVDAEKYGKILSKNASALEHLTGVDDEYYKQLQVTLLSLKVAPEQLDRFTKAALNMAAATGRDATNAAMMLARAHAEGKDEIKKYGIAVDEAEFKQRGFNAVLEQVEKQFGGLYSQMPEQVKQLNDVKATWEEFKETLGGVLIKLVDISGATSLAKMAIEGMKDFLTPAAAKQTRESMIEEMNNIERALETGNVGGSATFEQLQARWLELQKMLVEPEWLNDVRNLQHGSKDKKPKAPETDEEKRAREKRIAEAKKEAEELERISLMSAANLQKMEEAEMDKQRRAIEAQGDWEKTQTEKEVEDQKASVAGFYEWEHQMATEAEEKRQRLRDKRKEAEQQLLSQLQSFAMEGVNFIANQLEEALTHNEAYDEALKKAQLERRLADAEEMGAKKTATEVEKELQDEAVAAQEKKTAAFLAGIAKEAGVLAAVETAKAIASLANREFDAALQHGIAASAFGSIAAATGIGAAVISANRGLTADEKASIDSLNQRKKEREERAASSTTTEGGSVVQQTVMFFGIAGLSDIQQQAKLDEIKRKRDQLATGSG